MGGDCGSSPQIQSPEVAVESDFFEYPFHASERCKNCKKTKEWSVGRDCMYLKPGAKTLRVSATFDLFMVGFLLRLLCWGLVMEMGLSYLP